MTRAPTSLAILSLSLLALGACVTEAPERASARGDLDLGSAVVAPGPRAPSAGDPGADLEPFDLARDSFPVPDQVPDADPCVDQGCPEGLTCDWVQGCVTEVTFCCVDEMCGEGRFCDFEAGGVCAPTP